MNEDDYFYIIDWEATAKGTHNRDVKAVPPPEDDE